MIRTQKNKVICVNLESENGKIKPNGINWGIGEAVMKDCLGDEKLEWKK